MDEHLLSLGSDEDSHSDNDNSSDDDSDVEITSNPDECENELIRLSTYLQLESEVDNDDNQTFEWPDPPFFVYPYSSNDDQSDDSEQILPPMSNNNVHTDEKSMKRKRRQWTLKEKMNALVLFEKNDNKRETAMKVGCTTAQLRNWIKNKENLFQMFQQKRGSFPFYFSRR